jgi:hypothetical protein
MKRTSLSKQSSNGSTTENHCESAPLVRSYRVSDVSSVEISDLILPINHQLEDISIPDHEYLGSTESIIRKKSTHLSVGTPTVTIRKKRRKLSSYKSAAEIKYGPTSQSESDADTPLSPSGGEQKEAPQVKFVPPTPKMSIAKKRWIAA